MNKNEQQVLLYNALNFAVYKKYSLSANHTEKIAKEAGITKIYSTYNGEVLAEFNVNEDGGAVVTNQTPKLPSESERNNTK